VVIIRGGGRNDAFDIFNDEKVLNAFSNLKGYRILGLGHNSDITLLDCLADHSAITPTAAGIHLKEEFDELFARNHTLQQQKTQILKLQNDLKAKSDDMIALSANLKQLSERNDIQTLMNENKRLIDLNHELRKKVINPNSYILMFVFAIAAIIIGLILGRLF
jgi:exonuclease VII large subunit